MMWQVALSEEQLARCKTYAEQRSQPKRQSNVTNRRIGKQSDFDLDYLGLRGEFAFSEVFGLPVHQITTNLLQGDGGHKDFDLVGQSVSVKTRPKNRRFFLVPQYLYPPKADLMVMLEEIDEANILLKGWCTRQDFIDRHEELDLGYGRTRAIRDHSLRPMDELLYHLNDIMKQAELV
jgi:hypothetical protein